MPWSRSASSCLILGLASVTAVTLMSVHPSTRTPAGADAYVPGEVLLKFKPEATEHARSVALAEPNYFLRSESVDPNDPSYPDQWSLNNTGQSGGTPGADIHAATAWET